MKDSKPTEEVYETGSKTALEAIEELFASKGIPSLKDVTKGMDMKEAMDIVSEGFKEALKKKAAEEKAEEREEFNIFERYTRAVKNLDITRRGSNKAAIFVGNYMYTEGQGYTETQMVNYINKELLPWAFLNGIAYNISMLPDSKPTKSMDYNLVTEGYAYEPDIAIINYAMACMAAAKEHCRMGKEKITAIFYSDAAGKTTIAEYRDTEHFVNDVGEELTYLELAYLEATDRDE
ncbi:MAG: hypothetical protein J6V44_16480 [Methanobrevibacter sp.]|nr:hypothetical protein [Methanobrevibacter sp.]MBO7692002.1 hypothetical protein [Methanobrevibacter sp.]